MKRTTFLVMSLLIVASMVLAACQPAATPVVTEAPAEPVATEAPAEPVATEAPAEPVATEAPTEAPTEEPTPEPVVSTRKGGWLDEIVISVVEGDSAVTQLQAGAIDIYANGLSSNDLPAIEEAGLAYSTASGLYYDLLFNPVGPEFTDGRFNPFSNRKIREAMNWLVDRDYLNQEIYAGGALPKWFAITTQFPDYADLADVARRLEAYYAYDMDKAKEVIDAEMTTMGAELVDGKWNYGGEPVSLIFVIRNDSDGTRIPQGDYVAAQLESIGFTVDRQYKTGSEASPIWIGSDPAEGQWHIYTAAWSATVLDRDQSNIFQEMYLDSSAQGIPAFLANVSDPEFKEIGDKLANAEFATLEERHDLMARAMELSLQDSFQVFLIDGKNYIPYVENLVATSDLAAGVEGSSIYPFTLRFKDEEGGTVRWATQDLFAEPWNPIAGSNWAFDQGAIRATNSAYGEVVYDPFTGLVWPMRMERADVVATEGLPIGKTLDWVTLEFAPEITVPEDAWVDWDATNQVFVTAAEKFPEGQTALVKTTQYYPADMYETVKWHDGSNLSPADFIMSMIMTFDRAKPESAIYDEQAVPRFELFLESFKGVKFVSMDPLVVEYYTDNYALDAELNLGVIFPTYTFAEGSWPMMAIGNLAEAAGEVAYSIDKAGTAEIEQTSYVGGPTLEILAKYLDQAIAETTIPYAPTMSEYLTAEEATARYEAYKAWYGDHGHFWVGTGPYFLDQAFLTEKSLVLKHFADYPDLASKWSAFGEPKLADVEIDGPGQVKIGEEAQFDVYVNFAEAPYPTAEIKQVKYLLYNAQNEIVAVAEAEAVEDGLYKVVLTAETTSALEAGSNKLEVAVVPLTVSQPTFTSVEFVTAP
ncbi:MAG TPA: ABC transporter substrate-binding protein [Anaerolineales bacterium]|nr:ABC transporter substrate-binding protein [Anaerolineales bacterium]